jgi:hypothetical protein
MTAIRCASISFSSCTVALGDLLDDQEDREPAFGAVVRRGKAHRACGGAQPLPDPYLAIAEVLILVMAPIMVALMLAIHTCAPKRAKPFTQVALGWMLAVRSCCENWAGQDSNLRPWD